MFCIHYHLGRAYQASGQAAKAEYHFRRQIERPETREAAFAREALQRLDMTGTGGHGEADASR
jgi:hypothetical protein